MGLFRFLFVVFIVHCFVGWIECYCSTEYGAKPCPFVPSPHGEAPPCARRGDTFCEYPTHYPMEVVKNLVYYWKYDHNTLLKDETKYELNYYASDNYGLPHNNIQHAESYYPEATYGYPNSGYPASSYNPKNYTSFSHFTSTLNQLNGFKQQKNNFVQSNRYNGPQQYYNWNGRNKYYHARRRRSLSTLKNWYSSANFTQPLSRKKRQDSAQTLCRTRTTYVMPRAALNNKGTWMYVVNTPEIDTKYTQLVKTEQCVSDQCSGLCMLPNGYSAKCEQRYVQKRLIAVEGSGNQLYTDIFWFPSCCICTINSV